MEASDEPSTPECGSDRSGNVEVKVRCGGKLHRILLTLRGRLVFADHTMEELRAEEVAAKLSGESCRCRCFQVWQIWKEQTLDVALLPKPLRDSFRLCVARGGRPRYRGSVRGWIRRLAEARVKRTVKHVYDCCHYRTASGWESSHCVEIELAEVKRCRPSCKGETLKFWSGRKRKYPCRSSVHTLIVPWEWEKKCGSIGKGGTVRRGGKRLLVLDVRDKHLLVAKQGRGFDLNPVWVRAKKEEL